MRNFASVVVFAAALSSFNIVQAQTPPANPDPAPGWDQKSSAAFDAAHPRRAEVLNRDANEINKNKAAAQDGQITTRQARKLNHEDTAIRRQEQADARADGGVISKRQKRQLNKEENAVNRQRNRDIARDAAK